MSEQRCSCCARPLRRKLVLGTAAALGGGLAAGLARAQNDLLSPFAPVKPKPSAAGSPIAASPAGQAPAGSSAPPSRGGVSFPISEPRNMAEQTVSAIASLCRRATELAAQLDKLKAEIAALRGKRAELIAFMEAEMEDYRNGLFCSGCNRTKRDILSKGDTFPHPGQKIIAPTPEQIARKEAELQRPIDQATADLNKHGKDVDAIDAIKRDAQDQVGYGVLLWEASVGYERVLILRDTKKRLDKLLAEQQQIQKTLDELRSKEFATKQAGELRLLEEERRMWLDVQRKRAQAMQQERANLQQESAAADRVRVDEQMRLVEVVGNSKVGLYVAPNLSGRSPTLDAQSLGVRFRLGKLLARSEVRTGVVHDILPSVERFVLTYKQNGI
ncbi:hypothetical protein [Pseudoduganella namucuonensis]|uniref:Uncharacterized protein n=1 Tax=Pseudoduganella namucuonensis TaxID=1035707 RepID=A0A1I7KWL0_9BURK|nr:hypothetical protein [Pseudoduganella namucuonensis]SFV01694.1 hypothetical protein SAMN05216552_102067 [Pseudoduganella namucuonensis]